MTHDAPLYRWTGSRIVGAIAMIAVMGALLWRVSIAPMIAANATPEPRAKFNPIFNLAGLTIDRSAILSGGPGMDGIPSLTTAQAKADGRDDSSRYGDHPPRFMAIADSTLDGGSRVVGLVVGDEARAYPISILSYHEIINDTFVKGKNSTPIAIVYCPLCDSVTVFDRRVNGQVYEFGVSGLLHKSNVLLYDRTDHALWSQLGAGAISGPNAGSSFKHLAGWTLGPLTAFRKSYPNAKIMTEQTGFTRDYSKKPYAHYFSNDSVWFGMDPAHKTMANKEKIVGIRLGTIKRAYRLKTVIQLGTLHDSLGGYPVVIEWQADQTLRVVEHPPGAQVAHTFWFAWQAFWPDTEIFISPTK